MLIHHTRHHYSNSDLLKLGRGWQKRMMDRWADLLDVEKKVIYDATDYWEMARLLREDLELAFKLVEREGVEPAPGGRRDLIRDATSRDLPPDKAAFLTLAAFVYPFDLDDAQLPIQLSWASVGYDMNASGYPAGRVRFSWDTAGFNMS